MPAKPTNKNPNTQQQKKRKKPTVRQAKPRKLPKNNRTMLRRPQREWTAGPPNSHLRWAGDNSNWCEDNIDFNNCDGMNFEQQRQQNQWQTRSWTKDDYQCDSTRLGHQHSFDYDTSEQRRQSAPASRWTPQPQRNIPQASVSGNYSSLYSSTRSNRIPHTVHNVPPVLQRSTVERPTSPTGGSKLDMSLKTSINNILKGGSVGAGKEQADETQADRGEALLQRAETMCRQFRESREHAKKELEHRRTLEHSALDEQVVLYGERTRLKARGVLPEKAPVSSLAGGGVSCDHAHPRYGTDSWRSSTVPLHGKGVYDESRSQVRSVRDEPHPMTQKHAVPERPLTRVRRNSGETLNRDRISKLVNAPRSRKERLQLEKILQSHKPSGRPVVRPKLHLETTTVATTEGELDFSELPGDILQQIEMLIQTEDDLESEGVVHLDNDIFNPQVVDGALTTSRVSEDLHIEDLYSVPMQTSHSGTMYVSVASTSQSVLDDLVTCRRAAGDIVTTATGGTYQMVTTDSARVSQPVVAETTETNATHRFHQSLTSLLNHTGVTSTSPVHPASSSVQPVSTYAPECSSGMVHVKTESADACVVYSTPQSNSLPPVAMDGGHINDSHKMKDPEKVSLGLPQAERPSASPRSALTLDVGVDTQGQMQSQVQGHDGDAQDGPEAQAQSQTELSDSGSKRRSQISTSVSKEAKRQRVSTTAGTPAPDGPPPSSRDVSMSVDAPATGEATLARVLAISLQENQVISKLTDTTTAIEKLERLLRETREQLDRRLAMKQQLLDEHESLRQERLKILSEHKLLATSSRESEEADVSTRPVMPVPESMSFAFSAGTTVGGDGIVLQPHSALPTSPLPQAHDSVSPPSTNQLEINHSVSSSTGSTESHQTTEDDSQEKADVKPRIPRRKSASFCLTDSSEVGGIDLIAPAKTVNMSSGVCLNYVGTLEGQGTEAQPFLNDVASISPYVILEPLPGHWVNSGCSQGENSDKETQCKGPKVKKAKSAAAKPVEKRPRTRRNSSNEVSSDSTASKDDGCFKKPKPATKRKGKNNKEKQQEKKKYEKFIQGLNVPGSQRQKSRSNRKVSEVYPGPDANVHKKLKSKKARKQSSSIAGRDSSVDSSSDCSGQPNVSVSSASVKQSGKKRPNKRCTDPISKAVQQYLHAESSSDVEITGLQAAPAKTPTQSGQSVLDDSSLDDTSSVSSTSTTQSTPTGSNPGFISLSPPDNPRNPYTWTSNKSVRKRRAMTFGCYEGHEGPVRCIHLFRKFMLTGSEDGTVIKFKLRGGRRRVKFVFKGHTQGVSCIHVTGQGGDGIRVFTGSYDGTMLVFRFGTGVQLFTHHYGVQVNTMHSNWNKLFLGLGNGSVVKYDFQEYRNGAMMSCAESGITCLASAMEGPRKLLCVASNDCVITVRDAITGLLIRSLDGHTKTPLCMCVVNNTVYSGGTDKSVQAYNLNTSELLKTLRFRAVVNCIEVKHNLLFIACYDGTIRCYDAQTYKLQRIYYGAGKAAVMAMGITENKVIFTGNSEGFCEGVAMTTDAFKCECAGCDLLYATKQFLHHHVMTEHTSNNTKNAPCQWLNCNTYLDWSRNQQAAIKHMSSHIQDK